MSTRDLEQAFEIVDAHPDLAHFVGPRDEPLVAAAEKATPRRRRHRRGKPPDDDTILKRELAKLRGTKVE